MELDDNLLREVDDVCNIPGPIDWPNASHGITYDETHFLVFTYAVFGEDKKFRMNTKVRPMCESEIIFAKLRGHSRDAVRRAYEFQQDPVYAPPPPKRKWWVFWRK